MTHPLSFVPWADFFASWDWRQGEHVTVIGTTGSGKTTLLRALLRKRYDAGGAVAVLATKSRDANLDSWARLDGLTKVRDWPPKAPNVFKPPGDVVTPDGRRVSWKHRVMVWPMVDGMPLEQIDEHVAEVHRRAMAAMFWQGDWCVVGEELWELTRIGLGRSLEQLWTQGRSTRLSVIGATQRPVDISLFAYSQASHLFLFGESDERNLDRLRGIGGVNGKTLREAVLSLPEFDVVYIGPRSRRLVRTRVPVRKAAPSP